MKKVLIQVIGGVSEVVAHAKDVFVEIRDYDNGDKEFTSDEIQEAIES